MHYGNDLNITRYEEGTDGVKRRSTLDPQSINTPVDFVVVDSKDAWENYMIAVSYITITSTHSSRHWNGNGAAW
jgi:hypothetical protein